MSTMAGHEKGAIASVFFLSQIHTPLYSQENIRQMKTKGHSTKYMTSPFQNCFSMQSKEKTEKQPREWGKLKRCDK